jgi:hypothetical protein
VVQLQQDTDAAIAHTGQKPQLPQRAPAVHQLPVQSSGGVQELEIAPRRFNGGLVNVMPNVEPLVVDPQRATAQWTRNVKTPSQLRNVGQTAMHALADLLQPQLPRAIQQGLAFGHGQPAEVTRPVGGLEVEEHAVKRA